MTDTPPKLVNVGSYITVNDAEFARMLLEGEGIEVFLADATIVAMDWLLGNAVGWIKVQVASENEARARALLEAWQKEVRERPPATDSEATNCLECGQEIPLGCSACPACGWTYMTPNEEK
jgi:hypothetical protein